MMFAISGFLLGVAGSWLVMRFGDRIGAMDVPNFRSSHDKMIPKGAGLGILAALVVTGLVLKIPFFHLDSGPGDISGKFLGGGPAYSARLAPPGHPFRVRPFFSGFFSARQTGPGRGPMYRLAAGSGVYRGHCQFLQFHGRH
jgi:hypothetical protein